MKHKDQRVCVLVDIQNLYYSARVLHNKKVNFKNLLEGALEGRKLIRAIGYGISTEEAHEDAFFDALENAGYEVKTKELQIFTGGQKKGDWDVGIAVDAIKLAAKADVIILASGDGDYIPLVHYLQTTTGCRVEAVAFAESTSTRLIETVDDFLNLSDDKNKFLIGHKNPQGASKPTKQKNSKIKAQSRGKTQESKTSAGSDVITKKSTKTTQSHSKKRAQSSTKKATAQTRPRKGRK